LRILIVDNDVISSTNLQYSLTQDNYTVDLSASFKEAKHRLSINTFDMILLEPESEGSSDLVLVQKLRSITDIPILVTTKNKDEINKILAFEYGADDYLVKPFNILELKVRIKAILRRVKSADINNDKDITFGNYRLRTVGRTLVRGDEVVSLTGKEFDLLYVLSSKAGTVYSREDLMTEVWGYQYFGDLRSIDVHIRRLREKIEEDSKNPQYIKTKWGIGYYFDNDNAEENNENK